MRNYVPYHVHDELSLLDSVTKFKDYVDMAIENNMKAIACTNHGNIYKWIDRVLYCKEKGIKYLHGCEVYLTETHEEKIRDNYHTVLIAKNKEGIKELNTLVGVATKKDHMYYKPRLSFEEFLNISDNVVKISACLQSPLNKFNKEVDMYDKIAKHYNYYEIQYHNCDEQREYNYYLYQLSIKNNIPLIVGTDTHSSTEYKAECRTMRQYSKNITFENEDEFDLTFKNYEQLLKMFDIQNGNIPKDIILQAIENTNTMADSCEEIELDTSFKYPILSEDDEDALKQRVNKMYLEKVEKNIIDENNHQYLDNLREEFRVLKKIGMLSFMLFMSELIEWCENNNIPTCPCRGSVGGSTLAYITGITDVDPIKWKTYFSRFANEDRKEIGDIDVDFSPSQRDLVYKYIMDRFGWEKTAYILAIGTSAEKGTIDDIGRGLDLMYTKRGEQSPYTLGKVAEIKKEYEENQDLTREKYPELFYYFDGMVNTVVSQSVHPAGIVASPISLYDNYGVFYNKDEMRILQIDMEEVHEVSLVKYDILGLKNIEVIKDCCEYANVPYPKAHEINFDDNDVWEDMISCPVGIFQFESKYSSELLKRFQPHKINDLSLVNASLRPSGESYRDNLIARIPNKNPSKIIDDLLEDNNGYLVFQEDTIAFLQNICGLSGSDADNIRRAIGRKQKDRLDKAMPQILEGYCNKSNKPRHEAEKEAKAFLQIIEDSSNYQFGKNHSTGYSLIGYYCAYYRYYYPIEFATAYLNNANNDNDIIEGQELIKHKGIKLENPRFRFAKSNYFFNKETNTIYKGLTSIKFLNDTVAEQLYELKDNKYDDFTSLLFDIKGKTKMNSRQLDILIRLDFFQEFGKRKYLLDTVEIFNNLYGKRQYKKDKLLYKEEIIRKFSETETEKMFKNVDTVALIKYLEKTIPNDDLSIKEIIKAEIEYTGTVSFTTDELPNNSLIAIGLDVKYSPKILFLNPRTGNSETVKISKRTYKNQPLELGDIVVAYGISEKHKKTRDKETGQWITLPDTEYWLDDYKILSIE